MTNMWKNTTNNWRYLSKKAEQIKHKKIINTVYCLQWQLRLSVRYQKSNFITCGEGNLKLTGLSTVVNQTYRVTDVWTDVVELGTVLHTHGAPGGRKDRGQRLGFDFTERGCEHCGSECHTVTHGTWLRWRAWGWCDWSSRTPSPTRSRRQCSHRTWRTWRQTERETKIRIRKYCTIRSYIT